jgi:RNA polymerase sigma factor (sigma-70 family)
MSEAAAPAGFSRLLSDERLTRRAVGGDERAFAAIFRRYHQPLYRFCLAIVGNPEDAQDALQNTMMKVLRALPGEERKIELKPWLYRIAHNESIDLLRRRRETRQLDAEQAAPGYGLAEDVATRERLRGLLSDLRELPERQREVLVMRELAGLDFEEIGSALGTSDAVARQTLYEARQSLRQMEEGREMNCDEVTRALSDGDGRVLRRRDVRAHLRSCSSCRAFREEIEGRRHDLAAISPLPAAAVAGMLQGLVGGSGAATTGGGLATVLGGGAAKTIGASAAAKGVATVAVVAAVGVTAADRSGIVHLGLPGEGSSQPSHSAPATPGASSPSDSGSPPGAGSGHPGMSDGDEKGEAKKGRGRADAAGKPKPEKGSGQAKPDPHERGKGHQHGHESPAAEAPGQTPGHAGQGQEKEKPTQGAGGQEKAAGGEPPAGEPGTGQAGNGGNPDRAGKPEPVPMPEKPPPGQEAKEPPPNPPPAAPEPPSQAPQQSPSHSQGKGAEKAAGQSPARADIVSTTDSASAGRA